MESFKRSRRNAKATRDPCDPSRLLVHSPYNGQVIVVPICAEMSSYAKSMRLYQHRRIVAPIRGGTSRRTTSRC